MRLFNRRDDSASEFERGTSQVERGTTLSPTRIPCLPSEQLTGRSTCSTL